MPISETPKQTNIKPKTHEIYFKKDIKLSAIKEVNQNDEYSGNKQITRRE